MKRNDLSEEREEIRSFLVRESEVGEIRALRAFLRTNTIFVGGPCPAVLLSRYRACLYCTRDDVLHKVKGAERRGDVIYRRSFPSPWKAFSSSSFLLEPPLFLSYYTSHRGQRSWSWGIPHIYSYHKIIVGSYLVGRIYDSRYSMYITVLRTE